MCGICGELRFDGAPVELERIVAMREQLIHRGPDDQGVFVAPDRVAGLGFRRLAIVDLSANAHQPMSNEDGSVHVVFNGEIYNFQTIRRDLVANGHVFRSRSDTEVIVHLYEELGPACVDRLDGQFAIAVWDNREQRLTLARDRAGKKPLFVFQDGRHLRFASEIKAFFAGSDVTMTIDREMVPYFFIYGYAPCPRTLYCGVRQIEPGTVVTVDRRGHTTTRRYWSLRFPPADAANRTSVDRAGVVRNLRELMTGAVERRLVSDVPLGAFLSGGVDSTIIVGLMSRLQDRPVKTFSIGFKDSPDYDETAYARIAAERFKTDHTEFIVEPGAFELIEKLVWHHDGPFGDSSAVPTYIVSELTRRQVTVVLNGDGGDELFAGYLRFYASVMAERVPQAVRGAIHALADSLPRGTDARHWMARLQRYAASASLPIDERATRLAGLFYDDLGDLLEPDFRRSLPPIDPLRHIRRFEDDSHGLSPLSRILLANYNTYLLDDLLIKADRCTMANSLEARSPFLDTALVEYVATLPDAMKLSSRGRTKVILREAFDDLIPHEIQRRGKMGFGVPFGRWFRGALRDALRDLLTAKNARYREFLSTSYVQRILNSHLTGQADLGLPLWTLLCFEVWLRALPGWARQQETPAAAEVR